MMKHFLLFCLVSVSLQTYAQGSLETDRLALVALYNATDGDSWIQRAGWIVPGTSGDNPCGWYGVTCLGGRVTGLNLLESELNGNVPIEIGNLSQLKSLILGWSYHRDARTTSHATPIPEELGNLLNLEYLDLSGNRQWSNYSETSGPMPFSGPIPASLGNLTKLTYLDLSYRGNDMQYQGYLTGSIPKELGNLVNLRYLNLSAQKLSGVIPQEIGNLVNLEYLILLGPSCCDSSPMDKLHGPMPDLAGIPSSAIVDISRNAFTFDGLELNASKIDMSYGQAILPIYPNGGKLHVNAGGTMANNTYFWYRSSFNFGSPNVLVATIVGNNSYQPTEEGLYSVNVTNSIFTGLTLTSDTYRINKLPVGLVMFAGASNFEKNLLTWQTASETNNSGFDIEKSHDSRTFEKISFVDGGGNSKDLRAYNFIDENPFPLTYYRLKQIDYDGKFEYSRIIAVKRDRSNISVYPNPARNQLFVKDIDKEEDITIRNMSGEIILKQKVSANHPISTSKFSNGLYTISIGEETRKFVVQQ